MYYLYRTKNITPGDFYKMSPGEKIYITGICGKRE